MYSSCPPLLQVMHSAYSHLSGTLSTLLEDNELLGRMLQAGADWVQEAGCPNGSNGSRAAANPIASSDERTPENAAEALLAKALDGACATPADEVSEILAGSGLSGLLQPMPKGVRDLASSAEIWRACQAVGGEADELDISRSSTVSTCPTIVDDSGPARKLNSAHV